ncbi:TIGR02611 family protein [Corynebacterium pacaense]|uniref:TIGR02611 family protein n=1 Tax=Corynebacterium pacaense TaxID=1816684 RepID=UPI0009B9689D|nr:TIGR02611 family protein [Corynebacterium pacaense]
MSSMREMVADRIERLQEAHERSKRKKYGFLVRPGTLIVGWVVTIIGLITIPLPGQGWLTTFIGVGILSLELHWAKRLLGWGVHQYDRFFAWYATKSFRFRMVTVALMLVVIWIVFMAVFYGMWHAGTLPWADEFFQWLGVSR